MRKLLLAFTAIAAVTACGGAHGASQSAGRAALMASLSHGSDAATVNIPADMHLVDLLPQHRYAEADSVVVGTISAVTHRAGYLGTAPSTSGKPGSVVTSFDNPLADWRMLDVTVDVSEVLAGPQLTTVSFTWGLSGSSQKGENADTIAEALKNLGRVVVFTTATPGDQAGWYGINRDIIGIPYNLATVDDHNALHFPFVQTAEGPDEASFLNGVTTLAELKAAAAQSVSG